MTEYWLDFTTGGGTDDGGDGSEGNPFKSPYAARTAFATGGNIFHGKGRYIKRRAIGAANQGRTITPLASGTARNPSIMHGYDPAHPFEWWAGGMVRTAADSGTSWTDNGAGTDGGGGHVFYASMGYAVGGQESHAQHLLWYYDMSDQSIPPRQLAYMKDETGGAHAGVDAIEDSFWFDTVGQILWVHLRSGESPDGKIMLPSADGYEGDVWGGYPDNLFRNRQNIVFANFSYVYCGTRPWDASNVYAGGGHKVKNFEMWRSKLGYTWKTDAVIRPIAQNQALVIDESLLQCGGIGILYSYSGTSSAVPSNSTPGHQLTGLRISRSLLFDAGYTHRGQGDGHAIGSQASGSDWGCYGNKVYKCTKPIDFWHPGSFFPGVCMRNMIVIGNLIEGTHNSGVATGIRGVQMESIPTSNGLRILDGHVVSKNVVDGDVEQVANGYYNGTIFTGEGTKSCISYNLADADYAPNVDGNYCLNGDVGFLDRLNSANAEIGMHVRWNIMRGQSTYSFQRTYNSWPAGPNDLVVDYNDYDTVQFRAGGTSYATLAAWVSAEGIDTHSTGGP